MPRILVVEDDTELRSTMRELLELEGYEISTATNGEEALALLDKIRAPDLIFLDLMMPVMDGAEFLTKMRAIPAYSRLPVVVFSATVQKPDLNLANGFLKKPVELNAILETAAQYCQDHSETSSISLGS